MEKEISGKILKQGELLVSYYAIPLFTNVPVDEAIDILIDRAFKENWANTQHNLTLPKPYLRKLLQLVVKEQLFILNGDLYVQMDGVAMGSPLGPLMANTFTSSLQEKFRVRNELPAFYKRYMDDALSIMPNKSVAEEFLVKLNNLHQSLKFMAEIGSKNGISFFGSWITSKYEVLGSSVFHKPTDTGLLAHFQSHVDGKYKRFLIKAMLDRGFRLSSDWHVQTGSQTPSENI